MTISLRRAGQAWGLTSLMRMLSALLSIYQFRLFSVSFDEGSFAPIAMALLVVAFCDSFSELGSRSLVMTQSKDDPTLIHRAWCLDFLRALLLACFLFLGSSAVAFWTEMPDLENMLGCLSLVFLINGCQSPGLLKADQQAKAKARSLVEVFRSILIVGLAALWLSDDPHPQDIAWAWVAGASGACLLGWLITPWALRWRSPLPLFKQHRDFIVSTWALTVMIHIVSSWDDLIVKFSLGDESLSIYNRAYHFLEMPLNFVVLSLSVALLPYISSRRGDPEAFKQCLKVIAALSLGLVSLYALVVFLFAQPIYLWFLKGGYAAGLVVFPAISVFMMVKIMMVMMSFVLTACHQIRVQLWVVFLQVTAMGSWLLIRSPESISEVAWMMAGALMISLPLLSWATFKVIKHESAAI